MVRSVEGIGWYYLEPEVLKKGERAESMLTLHTITTEIANPPRPKPSTKPPLERQGRLELDGGNEWKEKERCNNCKE